MPRSRRSRRSRRRSGSRRSGKRTKNAFFTKMLAAKDRGDPSFVYKGRTYRRTRKGGLIYYR